MRMILKLSKILVILFSMFGIDVFADNSIISNDKYAEIKDQALKFEESLGVFERQKMTQAYAPIMASIFENCVPISKPTSFEILSLVDEKGKAIQNWSNTQTVFGQCAMTQMFGKQIYEINQQSYYAILNFNLESK